MRAKRHFWRTCRVYFRRFRIAAWLLVFALVCMLVYLNQVGLPDFIKKPLLQSLRDRGLDLQFSRVRLNWYGAIEADNVRIGEANQPLRPQLTAARAIFQLQHRALARLQFQLDSITLRGGRLDWTIETQDTPPHQITVEDIQTDLRFMPGDAWVLDNFNARFAKAHFTFSGHVAHASALRDWKVFKRTEPGSAGRLERQVRNLAEILENSNFTGTPELRVEVNGDAQDPQRFTVRISLKAPGAETTWGTFEQGALTARLRPATNDLANATVTLDARRAESPWANAAQVHLRAEVIYGETFTRFVKANLALEAQTAQTEWASGTNLNLKVALEPTAQDTNVIQGTADIVVGRFGSRWANCQNAHLISDFTQSLTNWIPLSGTSRVTCDLVDTKWAAARRVDLVMHRLGGAPAVAADASWGQWTNLQPYALDWDCKADEVQTRGVSASAVDLSGQWRAPVLVITNWTARLYGGNLAASANLDVATRAAAANLKTDFDPHKVEPLLTEGARRWLSQFTWQQPPRASGALSLILPAWTNSQPDWREEVRPTLRLQGEFDVEESGTYRGVRVDSARSHFIYSNLTWHLPDLHVTRPEGVLDAEHRAHDVTKEFYWNFQSTLDIRDLAPLLSADAWKLTNLVSFTQPPTIVAEVRGRSRDNESVGAHGRVAVSNFTFRGESFSGLATEVDYTNRLLTCLAPRVQRGAQGLAADGLLADFPADRVYITNGFSTADPMPVARAIGTNVARAIEPFRFGSPPRIHIDGAVPMHGEEKADVQFIIEGGPFHWLTFDVPEVAGNIHWKGLRVMITKVSTRLYGGEATGYASFHFKEDEPFTYEFAVSTTNTSLQPLVTEGLTATNHLEGLLSGTLVVTRAESTDWRTWDGYGSLRLRDGLIWDIPMFGVFSPILNGIAPGLGNSRANAGSCTFNMTNGVMRSDDLEIRCSGMRLRYHGTVDLHTHVNARVEAELLRDVWGLGQLFSAVFWPVSKMFEYKVTGTLNQPRLEPVYIIPRLMQVPTFPFRLLKGLLEETPKTNDPSKFDPPPQ